jgi:hypothetical protein
MRHLPSKLDIGINVSVQLERGPDLREIHLRSSSSTIMATANGRMKIHDENGIGEVPKRVLPHGV